VFTARYALSPYIYIYIYNRYASSLKGCISLVALSQFTQASHHNHLNGTEQNSSLEAYTSAQLREISPILSNPIFIYVLTKNPPMAAVLSHMNLSPPLNPISLRPALCHHVKSHSVTHTKYFQQVSFIHVFPTETFKAFLFPFISSKYPPPCYPPLFHQSN
jgi:hypothetical protein